MRAAVAGEDSTHADDKVVARIRSWLSGCGQFELTRCSTAEAAIAAAAPIALLQTQLTDDRDTALEQTCMDALERVSSRRLHKQRIHRTGHADAVRVVAPPRRALPMRFVGGGRKRARA